MNHEACPNEETKQSPSQMWKKKDDKDVASFKNFRFGTKLQSYIYL